jgi:hypothetical protein
MNKLKRLFKTLMLRLTWQSRFGYPKSDVATKCFRDALDTGILGFISNEGKYAILLRDNRVLAFNRGLRYFTWASKGELGSQTGSTSWVDSRPHIVEMYDMAEALFEVTKKTFGQDYTLSGDEILNHVQANNKKSSFSGRPQDEQIGVPRQAKLYYYG